MAKHITYRFSVTATRPLADDAHHPDFYTKAEATAPEHQQHLESEMSQVLRRFAGDCDVELLDYAVEDDDPHGADCQCDTCRCERCIP